LSLAGSCSSTMSLASSCHRLRSCSDSTWKRLRLTRFRVTRREATWERDADRVLRATGGRRSWEAEGERIDQRVLSRVACLQQSIPDWPILSFRAIGGSACRRFHGRMLRQRLWCRINYPPGLGSALRWAQNHRVDLQTRAVSSRPSSDQP
jgi:hypothetical protein